MDAPFAASAEHTLALLRRIPAAPDAVLGAWLDSGKVRQWMAPYGMDIPEARIEPRAGGRFDTLMRDASGKEYPNRGVIEAIEPGRRLVLRSEGGPVAGATATVTVAPDAHGTRLSVVWRHETEAMRAAHEAMGFFHGWGQTLDRLSALAATPGTAAMPGMPLPAPQHGWLHRLLGDWTFETEGVGPDGKAFRTRGTERVRALGPFWIVGEGEGECPLSGTARTIVTMGFDARAGRFRGSWVGSMMGSIFVYDGALDPATNTLALDTQGPAFKGDGDAPYRDVLQLAGDDTRTMTGNLVGADGSLTRLMGVTFRRIA
jgi:uncharacterized protein YndB with AHSA1/START domain